MSVVVCPVCLREYKNVRGVLHCCEDVSPTTARAAAAPRTRDEIEGKSTCQHRGEILGWLSGATCKGRDATEPQFQCAIHGPVVRGVDCAKPPGLTCRRCVSDRAGWLPMIESPRYLTAADLAADTLAMCDRLPKVARVIGVARSGMIPASLIATTLGAELLCLDMNTGRVRECGTGTRMLHRGTIDDGCTLLVDDSVCSGRSMGIARDAVSRFVDCRPLTAAIYVTPAGAKHVDIYGLAIREHVFEWNVGSPPYSESCGFDLDGLLCRDFTAAEDDDGELYLATMRAMTPTRLRPRRPITIITARLERYREPTETWLKQHAICYSKLIMGPWETKAEREADDVSHWKACMINQQSLGTYIESDPWQARRIHEISGCLVACPATREIWIKR